MHPVFFAATRAVRTAALAKEHTALQGNATIVINNKRPPFGGGLFDYIKILRKNYLATVNLLAMPPPAEVRMM